MAVTDFDLPRFGKARIWVNELPNIPRLSAITQRVQMECPDPSLALPGRAAIELYAPCGGFAIYGLLGAEINPTGSDFQIEIASTSEHLDRYHDTIASTVADDVRHGLFAEYARSVADSMTNAANKINDRPFAKITCNVAAHGLVGSNQIVFSVLARALISVLLQNIELNETNIGKLLSLD